MLVKAGEENAGLMDIGDGYGVVFKIESHNHPSAIEPFQGAATGVGGIHRDIFTMGARPIASLNSLRFGNLAEAKTQHLLAGVVHGIGHYGNCFGVPTVGGEIYFEECYHTNPLVNAMSVGILKNGETISATAEGEGNPVFFVGSATGKDGIGGASFASANITADSAEDLPAVQVGDPEALPVVRALDLRDGDDHTSHPALRMIARQRPHSISGAMQPPVRPLLIRMPQNVMPSPTENLVSRAWRLPVPSMKSMVSPSVGR